MNPAPYADRDRPEQPTDLLAHLGQAIAQARDGMTGKTTPSAGTSPVDPLRVERYAEALMHESDVLGAVIAVADQEQAELRSRLDRTVEGWRKTNAECISHWNRADAAEAKAEDFEGRYETAHDSRMHAERCLEAAQADLDGLRAQLEVATTARRLADAEVERLRAFNVQLAEGNAERLHRAVEREEAAKVNGLRLAEQLAKVRALADEWARGYNSPTASSWAKVHADDLLAILDAPQDVDPDPEPA